MAKASKRLELAQPTVSAQIHALERKLGRKLLERDGRGLKVTHDGEIVLRYASSIFALGGELLSSLDGYPLGHHDAVLPLKIGISSLLPQELTAMLLQSLFALEPRPALTLTEAEPEMLAEQLSAAALHFAMLDLPLSGVGLRRRQLAESPIALFAPEPLARKLGKGFPSCLSGAPILMSSASTLRQTVEHWLKARKLTTHNLAEMPHPELFAQAAKAGIFAPWLLRNSLRNCYGLQPVKQLDGAMWRLYLVTAAKGIRHPGIDAVVTAARELS